MKSLTLVGLGMGNENLLTREAEAALKNAEIVFGSKRMIETLEAGVLCAGKVTVSEYEAEKISEFLKNHPNYGRAVVCFSGDTGFFSGAAAFFKEFQTESKSHEAGGSEWRIEVANGIASPAYFAAKLHKVWQNWKMLSLHGAKCNVTEQIRKNPACFFILSGAEDVRSVGKKLETALKNGVLSQINCFLGLNLSYDGEKVIQISPNEMMNFSEKPKPSLFVLLVENESPVQSDLPVLCDEDFLRESKIPMTKQEVRQISLCALALSKSSIVYDIGSGTGSVTVEAARVATEGQVFAVECDETALSLTRANVEKFCLENVTLVHGAAPKILENTQAVQIPAPTHVFIGGSRGNLSEIVRFALQKNPKVCIVANFVSLENLCEMQNLIKSLEENGVPLDVEIRHVSVARAEKAGAFSLMRAQNPVWVVRIMGK